MYLLYLDESGNENDPSNRFFVLAGLALFERQIHHLNERLERVQEEHFPNRPPIPFHASAIRAGRGFWRGVSEEKRQEVLDDVISAMKESRLLQAADFIAHATWLLYERRYCDCPPCATRRIPGHVGAWIPQEEQLEFPEGDPSQRLSGMIQTPKRGLWA